MDEENPAGQADVICGFTGIGKRSMDRVEDNKRTIKTAVLNTIANVISLVIGMLVIPIITRVLSPEELGIASSFVSTRNTFVIAAVCAVYSYVHRAMLEYKENKNDYIYTLTCFCIVSVSVLFLVFYPFRSLIKTLFSLDTFLYYWLFVSALTFAVYSIGYYYCVFHNKTKILFFITLSVGPAAQFIAIGLALLMSERRYIGRVIGLDFAYLVVSVCVIIWIICFMPRKRFHMRYIKHTLAFSIPIVPHLLSQMVLTQCDLIMISYYVGEGKTGIYSMGHTVGFLAFTVMSQVIAVWSPWVYRRLEEKDIKSVYDNSKLMILIGVYMSVGLMTVSTELIKLFLTKAYLPCIYIVPPLVVAMFFQFIYLFLYDLEYYYKKAKKIAAASVMAAVLNFILNSIFIPKYGYIAACYTTVTSYLALVIINYCFSLELKVKSVYCTGYILGSVAFVSVYAGLMMLLKDNIMIRYCFLFVISAIFNLIEKDKIRVFLKNIRG